VTMTAPSETARTQLREPRPARPATSHRRGSLKRALRLWQLYLLLAPALVHLAVFKLWPMYGVQIAFRDYNPIDGFMGSPWVGWENLDRFLSSPQFERVVSNTVSLAGLNLLVAFPIPIVLALMIWHLRSGRVRAVVQAIVYSPAFISIVVVVGMMHILLSPRTGLVNHALGAFGVDPILFMGEPGWFRPLFVGSTVWQETGFNMVIYIAALAAVDPALHEAAKIDGANVWQRIRHVDLPGIASTVVVLFLLAVGNLLNLSFEKALLMQTDLNLEKSQVIQTYVYQVGLQQAQFSYSAAIGLFNSVLNLLLLVVLHRVLKRVRRNSEM
jgi:putative aldouronate transport system permease protein